MGGQINYALQPPPGVPGQTFDLSAFEGGDIVTAIAATIIPFGVACEYTAGGLLVPVQDTHANWPPPAVTPFAGISVYDPFGAEQEYVKYTVPASGTGSSCLGYPKGAAVPVMRRGRIWMAYDGGGTPTRFGPFNLWHSSDGTHLQGVATFSAVVTTAGLEIEAAPPGLSAWNPDLLAKTYTDAFGNTQGILGVSVNL